MFTGLIEAMGKVIKYDGNRMWLETPFRSLRAGESIAVDGVCLTLAARKGKALAFDLGQETQDITTLGERVAGDRVNLERALRVGDRVGGHWVSGHIDATGRVRKVVTAKSNTWVTVDLPANVAKYVRPKGSLTIDGISLTVAKKQGKRVTIMVIPHTLNHTTLGLKKPGDAVNLEADLYAKYILR